MKNVIVTGSSGNMGQAVVKKFIDEGYRVIGTIIPNETATPNLVSENFEQVEIDLTNEEESINFVNTVIKKYKTVDVAVLTVGGFALGKIEETSSNDIYKQYKLNFETTYNIVRPVFLQMIKQNSGRIFLTGSRPGLDAKNGKGMVAYGLAKSLIFRLAELLNEESIGYDVVTSVVIPSTIDTPQNRKAVPLADYKNWIKPEDIAASIYFYCTEEARMLREPVLKVYNNA